MTQAATADNAPPCAAEPGDPAHPAPYGTLRGSRKAGRKALSLRKAAERAAASSAATASARRAQPFQGADAEAALWDACYRAKPACYRDRHVLRAAFPELMPAAVRAAPRAHVAPLAPAGAAGAAAPPPDRTLLEVGCGHGSALFPVLRANPRLFGLAFDFSAAAVALVRAHPEFRAGRARVFRADVTRWESLAMEVGARGGAHFVTAFWALSALDGAGLAAAAANIARAMRPGARLLVRDFARGDMREARFRARAALVERAPAGDVFRRGDGTLAAFFDPAGLRDTFEAAGLVHVRGEIVQREVQNRATGVVMHRRWIQAVFARPQRNDTGGAPPLAAEAAAWNRLLGARPAAIRLCSTTSGAAAMTNKVPTVLEVKVPAKAEPATPQPRVAGPEVRSAKAPDAALGLTICPDGEASFTVWAPHAEAVRLRIEDPPLLIPLDRSGDHHSMRAIAGTFKHGDRYRVEMDSFGSVITRRDLYARATDYDSDWCIVQDPAKYEWTQTEWKRPEFADYVIYELHVGSFTELGTFEAAMGKLEHVKNLGFTCVQLMPILEHSDEWGYNPRQFFSIHGGYGTPVQFKKFVDTAHELGLAVIIDVVLHHAAVKKNALWNYDGWQVHNNGGIYHENAPDTEWGRALAHWKGEVLDMLKSSIVMYLTEYRCDGLRFDSANDLPHDLCQALTFHAHAKVPGCFLTAEVTPENPHAVHDLGFDNLWVHSAYFDIIHQHRALGRGHHGGGDWSDGWDFPRLRTVMGLHYGFNSPTQCTKYLLGSHDQIGCKNGGCVYEDYKMIGGQHRYACDQFGGGRSDPWAFSATRAWFVANCCAAGIPMVFMGSEWNQPGWWDTVHRQIDWSHAKDDIGKCMMALMKDGLELRKKHIALRIGGTNTLHEDRMNGVLAVDRIWEESRVVVVINAGRDAWQAGEYKVWVGGDAYGLKEVLCSADDKYGGWKDQHGNGSEKIIGVYDGFASINVPSQSSMIFEVVPV